MDGAPVTNIRKKSPHWRGVGVAHRCVVPFTAFNEHENASPKGKKQIRWFAPPERGIIYFASGMAASKPEEAELLGLFKSMRSSKVRRRALELVRALAAEG